MNPEYNINKTTSNGALGRNLSQEEKKRVSKQFKGRIRPQSERDNISKGKLGFKMTQEQKDKLSKSHINKPTYRSKPIQLFNLNNELIAEYEFIGQAAKELGIRKTSISNNANGRLKTAGGYIFKFK